MELNNKHLTNPGFRLPPKKQFEILQNIVRPHIDSFNFIIEDGLNEIVKHMTPLEFPLPNEDQDKISLLISDAVIGIPTVSKTNFHAKTLKIFPSECRQAGTSYLGKIRIQVSWSVNDHVKDPVNIPIGEVPIMVKSQLCSLSQMSPTELIAHQEEAQEMGGYFIINGLEKLIRMIVLARRNYPILISRISWKNRGPKYTEFGVYLRSVNSFQMSSILILHYLNDGSVTLSFNYMKEMFLIPIVLVLQALCDVTSSFIKDELCHGMENVPNFKSNVRAMLDHAKNSHLDNHKTALSHIGEHFRIKLPLPEWCSNLDVARFLIKHCICTHLESNQDKFHFIIFMTKKLYAGISNMCAFESLDNPMMQEVMLSGHLYLNVLKEKLDYWLITLRNNIIKLAKSKGQLTEELFNEACRGVRDITKPMEYLLATGNLVSRSGLGLMQSTGLSVIVDRLNFMRFLSHFRSIHRGSYFATLRTSTVRKLLPESWGFICPVHTPDGAPCGLLNHLTADCEIVTSHSQLSFLPELLCSLGMTPYGLPPPFSYKDCYPVILDGCMVGWINKFKSVHFTQQLRLLKIFHKENVPPYLEIVLVPIPEPGCISQFPGLYLFTTAARMMRPVKHLLTESIEMIGTFEQVYLNICVDIKEAYEGLTTYQEISKANILSIVAGTIPFSSNNQSPRNIYQCQMGKQTMGVPVTCLWGRADNKLYCLQTPQSPLVRPQSYDDYHLDILPTGTNAIVAVISYTSYDMEDAIVVNKSSLERGFAYGTIYKSEWVDLKILPSSSSSSFVFGRLVQDPKLDGLLDNDGLPHVGRLLKPGEPFYSYLNVQTNDMKVVPYKGQEAAYINQIKIIGYDGKISEFNKVCFMLRIPRKPLIGDKFASRHGQKGICSRFLPIEDMPFSEQGITPDIIFNPHGFPSRMTVGMMIETMAGKSASLHGLVHDATPFNFSEEKPSYDYFGKLLQNAGYDYYGTEKMYSGIDGRLFEANIFMGVVYYQRLRHMVSDKFQVRTVGPVDNLTHQPVHGRKRGGGIRFGEMERDSLLAHGTSFLLQDRLFNCSDKSKVHVCITCGSILTPRVEKKTNPLAAVSSESPAVCVCSNCNCKTTVVLIAVPYVFRYLVTELAAMGIKVSLNIKE